jgi:DNA-binding transcriptional MerR regulator
VDKAPDAFRTISEVAEELDLPQHVLRFWETRFAQIRPMKRGGGRRYYRPDDVDLLRGIRHLLYGEGYTIRGVQRILKDHGVRFVQTVWQAGAPQPARAPGDLEHEVSGEKGAAERGRGLFGLLPSLLGKDDEKAAGSPIAALSTARREPPIEDVTAAAPAENGREGLGPTTGVSPAQPSASEVRPPASSHAGLPREDVRKLKATLIELTECRRLIDAVLTETA